MAHTKGGGPGEPLSCDCLNMLPNLRSITPNDDNISSQPMTVDNLDTRASDLAVASERNPHSIQQIVDVINKRRVSVEFVPLTTAITNNMMEAVMEYSTHLIQLLPLSTAF